MPIELFAGVHVSDLARAVDWYSRVLGSDPMMFPNDAEAVWELADGRFLYVELAAEHAGHAVQTLFVDDLDARVDAAVARGVVPARRETYGDGVRKVTFLDPDGNRIGFGGASLPG